MRNHQKNEKKIEIYFFFFIPNVAPYGLCVEFSLQNNRNIFCGKILSCLDLFLVKTMVQNKEKTAEIVQSGQSLRNHQHQ